MIRFVKQCMSCFLLLAFGYFQIARAQVPDTKDLKRIKDSQTQATKAAAQLRKQQKKMLVEIDNLQTDLIREAANIRGLNRQKQELQTEMERLQKQRINLKSKIYKDRLALSDTLAAMMRLEKNPPPALLVHPDNAIEAARSARLLDWLSESLQARAKTLNDELVKLAELKRNISNKQDSINKLLNISNKKISNIKSLIKKKNVLSYKLDKDRKAKIAEAARLAQQAENLSDLIAKFEARARAKQRDETPNLRPDGSHGIPTPRLKPAPGVSTMPVFIPPGTRRFADARGQIPLPVTGRLIRKFGAPLAGDARAKGLSLRTAKGASVIAPFNGRVEFAGLFNGDHVIILNVGGGYFIVLTGLGETLVKTGTHIRPGEPLGLMPKFGHTAPELFMEFRKNRASINPMPWVGWAFRRAG